MGNYLFWAWFILIVGYYVYLAYKRIIAHYDERIKQAKQELEREQRIYEATLKKIENREALLKNMTSEAPGGKITSASLYDDKIHFFTKN